MANDDQLDQVREGLEVFFTALVFAVAEIQSLQVHEDVRTFFLDHLRSTIDEVSQELPEIQAEVIEAYYQGISAAVREHEAENPEIHNPVLGLGLQ
ncbi:hypothetical protein [Candidatus Rariloculus sp.]|uniref:hypothetical protein n=1 Tax=Candidatus Rariloculus sp. TaxID=3101265 RepID=UPI003D1427F1